MVMKATIGHIGINLSNAAKSFRLWKGLLKHLGFEIVEDGKQHFDASDGTSYLCVGVTGKAHKATGFHRKRTGLNHIAFRLESRELVDQFAAGFLVPRKIQPLYGGAKAYPEYVEGYYAVYFEDPDRIKVEVVYEPSWAAYFTPRISNIGSAPMSAQVKMTMKSAGSNAMLAEFTCGPVDAGKSGACSTAEYLFKMPSELVLEADSPGDAGELNEGNNKLTISVSENHVVSIA